MNVYFCKVSYKLYDEKLIYWQWNEFLSAVK